jgi:hypothetical protein
VFKFGRCHVKTPRLNGSEIIMRSVLAKGGGRIKSIGNSSRSNCDRKIRTMMPVGVNTNRNSPTTTGSWHKGGQSISHKDMFEPWLRNMSGCPLDYRRRCIHPPMIRCTSACSTSLEIRCLRSTASIHQEDKHSGKRSPKFVQCATLCNHTPAPTAISSVTSSSANKIREQL